MPGRRRKGDSRMAAMPECRGPPVQTAADRTELQEDETVRTPNCLSSEEIQIIE